MLLKLSKDQDAAFFFFNRKNRFWDGCGIIFEISEFYRFGFYDMTEKERNFYKIINLLFF